MLNLEQVVAGELAVSRHIREGGFITGYEFDNCSRGMEFDALF